MFKNLISKFAFVFCLMTLFLSCENNFSGTSLRVTFPQIASRSVHLNAEDIVKFEAQIANKQNSFSAEGKPGEIVEFHDIPVGSYDVTVQAVDKNGTLIAHGKNSTEIEFGKQSEVMVQLKYVDYPDEPENPEPIPEPEPTPDPEPEPETPKLTSITVDAKKVKTDYLMGEELETSGLVVTAVYENYENKIINLRDGVLTFTGFDSSNVADSQTITVSYTENEITKTATYTIKISYCYQFHKTLEADSDSDGFYYFGDWPQTILASSSSVTVDEAKPMTVGGHTYYLGSDGNYYAKVSESPKQTSYTYSDSSTVSSGSERYFKVEPIKWKAIKTDGNKMLLLSDKVLTSGLYFCSTSSRSSLEEGETIYKSSYKYSQVRAYLNGIKVSWSEDKFDYSSTGFLQTAFGDSAELILETTVDNSQNSTNGTTYVCENTKDKIFLMSYKEMINTEFGFNANNQTTDSARSKSAVDFAIANGVSVYDGHSQWWLRSPNSDSSVNGVSGAGVVGGSTFGPGEKQPGVVPAMWVTTN